MGEVPLLKELASSYKDRGLQIIGVSLDDDPKAFSTTVTRRGINWPEVREGGDSHIARLFNVKSTPAYFLVDRGGKIAAKNLSGKKLRAAVQALFPD